MIRPLSREPIFTLRQSVALVLGLLLFYVASVAAFHFFEPWRTTITFGAALMGGIVALYGIFVSSDTLRRSYEQAAKDSMQKRVDHALTFAERWNSPAWKETKKDWRAIYSEVPLITTTALRQKLLESVQTQGTVIDVLNFFEELSISVNTQLADEDAARRFFESMAIAYYTTFEKWIDAYRHEDVRKANNFCELESWLVDGRHRQRRRIKLPRRPRRYWPYFA